VAERDVLEGSPKTIDVVKLGAVEDSTVDREGTQLDVHDVTRKRDDLFEDRAAPTRTTSRPEVAARAPEACET
jgi:hypothetical protein